MSFEETHPTGQTNIKIVKFSKRKNYYLYIYEPQTRKVGYSSMGSYDLEYCKKNWFKVYQEYVDKGGVFGGEGSKLSQTGYYLASYMPEFLQQAPDMGEYGEMIYEYGTAESYYDQEDW